MDQLNTRQLRGTRIHTRTHTIIACFINKSPQNTGQTQVEWCGVPLSVCNVCMCAGIFGCYCAMFARVSAGVFSVCLCAVCVLCVSGLDRDPLAKCAQAAQANKPLVAPSVCDRIGRTSLSPSVVP